MAATPTSALSLLTPGAQVVVRDEEWLVRAVQQTRSDGRMVKVIGSSELVRDQEATFFTELDDLRPLRPEDTRLVADPTPGFRRSRLWLEALLRKTPLPASEAGLATAGDHLVDELGYQLYPAHKALQALRPRLLIADAVGLGKTLEVGILLSELIRRGRGDRILVVTPRHILEQFQLELWTRFSIPLVRLDSEGIQRVRQKIPATRNPFTFFKRVIISIDTLKSAGRYRHHLEGIRWDAVVIDECHSLMNRSTLNHQLATVLAPRTEALILTSATPHNGQPESFAELVRMLDPTAIADHKHYDAGDIGHLYLRRHKASPEVKAEVGHHWPERRQPKPVKIPASPEEDGVFDELDRTWLYPDGGRSPAAVDPTGESVGVPAVLMTRVAGRVAWDPRGGVDRWLRRLADTLPPVHAVVVRSEGVGRYFNYEQDSYAPPQWAANPAVWERAVDIFHGPILEDDRCFVHRDFHPGNVLWQRGRVTSVVDWQSACTGPPSVDIGHCRANLLGYAPELADVFTRHAEEALGITFHPWADIAALIGMLDGLRRTPPRPSGRTAIEAAVAHAVAALTP